MTRPHSVVLLIALLVPSLAGPHAADEPPATSKEQLEQQLKRIGNFTSNARVKLFNGVVGRVDASAGSSAPTPALLCCEGNLNKLGESVRQVTSVIAELDACYARQGKAGSSAMTVVLTEEVRGYARSLQLFADAPGHQEATAAIQAMIRGHNRMKTRLEDVEDCGATESGAP